MVYQHSLELQISARQHVLSIARGETCIGFDSLLCCLRKIVMKRGDVLIWDSGVNYSVVKYIRPGKSYNTATVSTNGGSCFTVDLSTISPYSENLLSDMKEKYD